MSMDTSLPETRCLVYQRSGIWLDRVQQIDRHYSESLKRPEGPNVLVEFVSPLFKHHYQVEVARADIRTLKNEHKEFQIELDKSRNQYRQAEIRIDELSAQIRTHEENFTVRQGKEAHVLLENHNLRSELASLNKRYLTMESLQRDTTKQFATQNEQFISLKDRLSAGPNEASKVVMRENQVLKLQIKAFENQKLGNPPTREPERKDELLDLQSTVSAQKDLIQQLDARLAAASTASNDIARLQTTVQDLQQQNAIVSAKKQKLLDVVKEMQVQLVKLDPSSSSQSLNTRKEVLDLKMQLKELRRSEEASLAVSEANSGPQMFQGLWSQGDLSKSDPTRLSTPGLRPTDSSPQEKEVDHCGKEGASSPNFFYLLSEHIANLDLQLSISASFQDEKKREVFIQAKIAAQDYLNQLGKSYSHLWSPDASASYRTPSSDPAISDYPTPTLSSGLKRPLVTPLLPSEKRLKLSPDMRDQDVREHSMGAKSVSFSPHQLPESGAPNKKRCDHDGNYDHDHDNITVAKMSSLPRPHAFSIGGATKVSPFSSVRLTASTDPVANKPIREVSSQSLHRSKYADWMKQASPGGLQSQYSNEPYTPSGSPQIQYLAKEVNDVIKTFQEAGYSSCYETSQMPQKTLYTYKRIVRIFKVQPWEITDAPPQFWSRDLLQSLSTFAEMIEHAPNPLERAKAMLEEQIRSRAATGSDAVLKLGDVRKAILECKASGSPNPAKPPSSTGQ